MGFNTEIRRARNSPQPLGRRFLHLRKAVQSFSPNGFATTLNNLEAEVGVCEGQWTAEQIARGLDLLERSRNRYMGHRSLWDRQRRRNKSQGQASPTSEELAAFAADAWFDSVSAGSKPNRWALLAEWAEVHDIEPAPFGPELAEDLKVVGSAMPTTKFHYAESELAHYGPYPLRHLPGQIVAIPSRVYNEPIPDLIYKSFSETQQSIADCLYSRSHDGHRRQRHLEKIVSLEYPWVVPYVVLALGDYVVEIAESVETGLANLGQPESWQASSYRTFADHNSELIKLVRARAISYWDCYYSDRYALSDGADLPMYPSLKVLSTVGLGHGQDIPTRAYLRSKD